MSNVTFSPIPSATIPDLPKLDSSLGNSTGDSFASVLSDAVHKVDQLHDAAATQVGNLLRGGGGDLNDVMIAVEKADVSFQLMMQVRNKIVSAYQDIEKMQF
ncbi:MAG: flagellar hook-basal body complex protein FliE [Terracidiphilus sp.]|jgi:flagellar hook-basal body complex protein FliE